MLRDYARRLRRDKTTVEQRLWARLRDRQLDGYKFRRQLPRGAFVADFACLECKLVVELDGGPHAAPIQRDDDRKRSASLQAEGYRVIRFWTPEVPEHLDGVLATTLEA